MPLGHPTKTYFAPLKIHTKIAIAAGIRYKSRPVTAPSTVVTTAIVGIPTPSSTIAGRSAARSSA